MDQEKIGKFISDRRKEKGLTQESLALKLNLTSKAISKWECGKGLPDVSIMLNLCEILDINIMDLLKGEFSDTKLYKRKTEGSMLKKVTLSNALKNNFSFEDIEENNINKISEINDKCKNVVLKVKINGLDIIETVAYYEIMMEIEDETEQISAMIVNPKTKEVSEFIESLQINNTYIMKGFLNINDSLDDKVFIVRVVKEI